MRIILARRARILVATFIGATCAAVGGADSSVGIASNLPAFRRPTIVGVQAGGNSEPGLRIDTHGRIYVDSPVWPYSAVWRSLDGGATFKWIPAAAARTGRLPTCQQPSGGDSEVATDTADRLYFSDRLAAQASPYNTAARSDDQGATFRSTCSAVASDSTDRPWYAIDGDPLHGGSVYLALAIIGGDRACTSGERLDQLALARSPVPGRERDAGILFGPLTIATGPCAMGLLGNAEVSAVSHHVFTAHSQGANAKERAGDEVRVVRCAPVPFSSDEPSGLSCVDRLVAAVAGGYVIDVVLAVDRAGTVYVVWGQVPFDTTGGAQLFLASSQDDGDTWTAPKPIPTPGLRTNIFPWIAAGDTGRLDLAWYGTSSVDPDVNQGCGGPGDVRGDWGVYFTQTLDALAASPEFTPPSLVSEHFVHRGGIASAPGGKFCGNGVLGDFLQLRIGLQGEANIVYADSNNANGVYPGVDDPNRGQLAHPMFVRQNGGSGLDDSQPVVHGEPAATNRVRDADGDATFDANGRTSDSERNLDILASSITRSDRRLRIVFKMADLRSLKPATSTRNHDKHLVWLVQWFSPSTTDPHGGKNLFAYMESANGRRPRFWIGESARAQLPTTAPGFTYPGSKRVTGSYTRTAPGTITIEVPMTAAYARNPTSTTLYHVTASTLTLGGPANRPPPVRTGPAYLGGSFFNLIDSAPSYDFVP
jgi:hypothetical protein